MESPIFSDDDDDEVETPRTHIQQFLSNVVTDPRHSLSSKRKPRAQSFVRTPVKNAKSKEKYSLRLSTSLPSPGSLITPKTNLQHLLLGSDTAKTPLDRRVASTRSARLSSKSFSHQPPQEWGQKVSLSPMFASSPSNANNTDSPSKTFKRPQHHRSFRIPEPPTNNASNGHLRNGGAVNKEDEEVQFDDAYSLNRNDGGDDTSPPMTQHNSQRTSPPKDSLQVLEEIKKSLEMEKARKIYELATSSVDEEEDSFTGPEFSFTSRSRNLSLRKSSNKTLMPDEGDNSLSRRDISNLEGLKQKLGTPISSSTKIADSSRLTNKNASAVGRNMLADHNTISKNSKIYNDDGDVSQFQILSSSRNNTSANRGSGGLSKTPRKNESLKNNAGEKNLQSGSSFKAGSSSRFSSSTSELVNKFQSRRSPRAKVADVSEDKQQMLSEAAADVSISASYSDEADASEIVTPIRDQVSSGKKSKSTASAKSLSNSNDASKMKVSEVSSPIKIQHLRKSLSTSSDPHDRPQSRSPENIQHSRNNDKLAKANSSQSNTPIKRQTPRKSMSTSKMNDSESKSTASAKSLRNSSDASKMKVSEASTPIKIQHLRKSLSTSSGLHDRPQSRSPGNIQHSQNNDKSAKANSSQSNTPIKRQTPRKSMSTSKMNDSESIRVATTDEHSRYSPRKGLSASEVNNSESRRTQGVKRSTAEDRNVDIYQFSEIEVPADLSQLHPKRHKTNSLNDLLNETNPSSSTPFKRSKSVFSSTRMQASMSSYLAPKETDSRNKSVAIGDLSPIRPCGENELNAPNSDPEEPVDFLRENRPRSETASTSKNKEYNDDPMAVEEVDEEEEELEDANNYTPLKTPVIDMNKQPPYLSGKAHRSKAMTPVSKTNQPGLKKAKLQAASSKNKSAKPSSIIPRKTIKFMSELYSSMKIDKEALDELEIITEQFMANTLEAAECYSEHAGRKTVTEADFVLMMKKQKLVKTKEDLYDLIRKYLPMELRCELIPCFPSHQ